MNKVSVSVSRLPHAADLALPRYGTEESAGADLLAAVDTTKILHPGERMIVPTGLKIALPSGYEAQIRPRSGLAIKNGLTCLNSPGTIDADYRGEIGVILINHGTEPFEITRGMRIAQMVIAPFYKAEWKEASDLEETSRGEGGFGSTGTGG